MTEGAKAVAAAQFFCGHARDGVDVQQAVDVVIEARIERVEVCGGIEERAVDAARIEADEAMGLPQESKVERLFGAREQAVDEGDLVRRGGLFPALGHEGGGEHLPDQRPQARHHRGEGRDVAQKPEGRTATSHARSISRVPGVGDARVWNCLNRSAQVIEKVRDGLKNRCLDSYSFEGPRGRHTRP